jgi:hypothetical protein
MALGLWSSPHYTRHLYLPPTLSPSLISTEWLSPRQVGGGYQPRDLRGKAFLTKMVLFSIFYDWFVKLGNLTISRERMFIIGSQPPLVPSVEQLFSRR